MTQPGTKRFEPLWTQQLQNPVRGLSLARETDSLLAWDEGNWLYFFNHAGQRQAQVRFSAAVIQACSSDDGSAVAVIAADGLYWLGPDLAVRRQQACNAPLTLAVDPFGHYAVVADNRGKASVFNSLGEKVGQLSAPRAFHHLAFLATAPVIAGCADLGFVGCFNLQGQTLWRHGLVANAGGLASAGDGSIILVACFSEGLQRYNLEGSAVGRITVAHPCRLVCVSFDGQQILTAGMGSTLLLIDKEGNELGSWQGEQALAAITCGALGDYAIAGDANGAIRKLAVVG